ncbi:kinase-like protein, partial [Trifolium medium]|nr:kinase-like protein [Trifolium medium]
VYECSLPSYFCSCDGVTRVDSHSDGFFEGVTKWIGNGTSTSFWFDSWVDGVPLRIRYQSLFRASDQCLARVVDISAFSSTKDEWCWRHELDGLFSVKSTYLVLEDRTRFQRTIPGINIVNLARVWDSWAASKVIVFSWQLLQDRVPTRQNLRRRRVMVRAIDSCVFCGAVEESVDHLFISCGSSTIDNLVDRVKLSSYKWFLGKNLDTPVMVSFLQVYRIVI